MAGNPWVIVIFLGAACLAAGAEPAVSEPKRPACNAQMRGKLWPEKTSRGAGVPIEICVPKRWKYTWQQLTIDVSQMKAMARRKAVMAGLGTPQETPTK
jgi:hypothetical protein